MSRLIAANHAHVFPESVRPNGSVKGLLQIMDACGIAKAVCFAPFPDQIPPEMDRNEWLAGEIDGNDRLAGFGTIDFTGDIPAQVRRIFDLGLRGIKVHPAYQKVKVDSEECFRLYEVAQAKNLFLSFHTGIHWHRIAEYNLLLFDEVAWHFPRLRFSMEHVGGYCFFNEAVGVMLNNAKGGKCNVFAGLTSVFDRGNNRFWYQSDERIRDLLWLTGEKNAIFGLDYPYNQQELIQAAIDHLENMDIPESAKDAIFGGNLLRELQWE